MKVAIFLIVMHMALLAKAYSFSIPENWQRTRGLFGMSDMIYGPYEDGFRPIISIEDTYKKGIKFNDTDTDKIEREYKTGRMAWLETRHGVAVSFQPYEVKKLDSGQVIRSLGYIYELSKKSYEEETRYITCPNGQVYNLKSLVKSETSAASKAQLRNLIESFKCN